MKFGIFGGARVGRADTLHDSGAYEAFIDYKFRSVSMWTAYLKWAASKRITS